jgi:uncharacterized protein
VSEGSIARLYRWPVKSFAGERLDALTLRSDGVEGDRSYAVTEAGSGLPLSARRAPRLLQWSATYEGRDPAGEPPVVTAPDGSVHEWAGDAVHRLLEDTLGRPVSTAAAPGDNHDRPGTVLVTTEPTRTAVEAALGLSLDVRRFRTNVHLDLDVPPYAEERWEGWELRFAGGAVLELVEACDRCVVTTYEPARPRERRAEVLRELQLRRRALFGIRAEVRRPGRIAVGEAVEARPGRGQPERARRALRP